MCVMFLNFGIFLSKWHSAKKTAALKGSKHLCAVSRNTRCFLGMAFGRPDPCPKISNIVHGVPRHSVLLSPKSSWSKVLEGSLRGTSYKKFPSEKNFTTPQEEPHRLRACRAQAPSTGDAADRADNTARRRDPHPRSRSAAPIPSDLRS